MSYLSLEEAAAKLGISTDRLVELRSQGQVRGFRDGSSWKFPDTEIERLAEDLAAEGAGSGILVDDATLGDSAGIGSVIGADDDGSDVNVGSEPLKEGGSDVNLVAGSKDDGSDVELVTSESKASESDEDEIADTDDESLAEIDSADLNLSEPAMVDDDSIDSIDIAIDPKEGSTGPVAKDDVEQASEDIRISSTDLAEEQSTDQSGDDDLSFAGELAEADSDDLVLGEDSEDSLNLDVLDSDQSGVKSAGASSLELMGELDSDSLDSDSPASASGALGEKAAETSESDSALKKSSGADVLSELDLLGQEKSDSGNDLISGDSEELLGSSAGPGEVDDALDDDDDLVIADDDAELMLDSVSDISVAGDSGINLMSPSDSGLSLESEPLDLAGSSLSALDLGAELADGSGISGSGSGGSASDFAESEEEFQLSPSGIGIDGDDSSSQVIEVEDSEDIGDAVDFNEDFGEEAGFAEAAGPVAEAFGDDDGFGEPVAVAEADPMAADAMALDDSDEPVAAGPSAGLPGYEVPFSLMQCLSLMFIILIMALGGMLMTDLVRNMWAYSETSAPVSGLTDSLIGLMGWDS
jgi:excisionase family DNA binding protein